jgi:hypothetical protein
VKPWYLVLRHDFMPRRPDEYIGPFESTGEAHDHRILYGPVGAYLTQYLDAGEADMTPSEHVDYLRRRL